MKKQLLIVLQAICLLGLFNSASAESDHGTPAVAGINQSWNAAFNSGDMDTLATLYAEDAILSAGDGAVIKGREAIQALFQTFIDGGFHDHTIDTISAHQEGDLLYQVAHWQVLGKQTDEAQMLTVGGILTSIYKRDQQGNWKAVVHTWNAK